MIILKILLIIIRNHKPHMTKTNYQAIKNPMKNMKKRKQTNQFLPKETSVYQLNTMITKKACKIEKVEEKRFRIIIKMLRQKK